MKHHSYQLLYNYILGMLYIENIIFKSFLSQLYVVCVKTYFRFAILVSSVAFSTICLQQSRMIFFSHIFIQCVRVIFYFILQKKRHYVTVGTLCCIFVMCNSSSCTINCFYIKLSTVALNTFICLQIYAYAQCVIHCTYCMPTIFCAYIGRSEL